MGVDTGLPFKCGNGCHPILLCVELFRHCFSITVQWNRIKFGVLIAPGSDILGPSLWQCSSFGFGVEKVYNLQI